MYGTTVRVIAAVMVETVYGYERKNSSATTLQPVQSDDIELVVEVDNEVVDEVHVQFCTKKY
jgi:hypothetical protein